MKITILILSVFILGGCKGEITKYDLKKGDEFCYNKGGLRMYYSHDLGHRIKILCNDGSNIPLSEYKLKNTGG